jgi:hypothetical protein
LVNRVAALGLNILKRERIRLYRMTLTLNVLG